MIKIEDDNYANHQIVINLSDIGAKYYFFDVTIKSFKMQDIL